MFGGLGNQLFQYYFGQFLKEKYYFDVEYDLSWVNTAKLVHSDDIRQFKIPNEQNMLTRPPAWISRKLHNVGLNQNYLGRTFRLVSSKLSAVHFSDGIGYVDEDEIERKDWHEFVGYFQSYRYFESIGRPLLELKSQSSWFKEMKNNIEKHKAIGVHIRRGDYLENKYSIGLIADEYFTRIFREIVSQDPTSKIMVFSDDLEIANKYLKDFPSLEVVTPPKD